MDKGALVEDVENNEEMIDETEKIILDFTDQMWNTYDTDQSGHLNKEQCINFLNEIFREAAGDINGVQLENEDLDILFEDLDIDGSGSISKDEFRKLIKDATGL